MIAHVAQAGEDRGRVVLQLRTGQPSAVALHAAVRVARAFQSEIETLFVEDQQLFDLARFPFAREVSRTGRQFRSLSVEDVERDMRLAAIAARRRVEEFASAAEVPLRLKVVRDEPVHALAAACAECGPWNVVVLGEPFIVSEADNLRQVLETVSGTTGIVLVGPKAARTEGPVIAVVEDLEQLLPALRTAERLLAVGGDEIVVQLIAEDDNTLDWMEGQARLAIGSQPAVRIALAHAAHGDAAALAEVLRRLKGGFVVSSYGGLMVPTQGDLRHLAIGLECPLFLMR